MLSEELIPPPPAESGMENRVTRVFVLALVVHSTKAPLLFSVTARRPDASPATKRMSRTGGDVRASGERRQCTLDLADDGQRHRERLKSVLPSDDDGRAALYRGEKALELES